MSSQRTFSWRETATAAKEALLESSVELERLRASSKSAKLW
jgi:hypothetical protein